MCGNRTAAWYQWWHAELNRMLFDGELEPPIIHMKAFEDGARAEFQPSTDPYLMTIYEDEDEDDMDQLTILLHEMCHEYVFQFDLVNDNHGPMFQSVALEHGMAGIGYALTDEAHGRIERRLKSYDHINAL